MSENARRGPNPVQSLTDYTTDSTPSEHDLDAITADIRDALAAQGSGGDVPSGDNRFVTDDELSGSIAAAIRPSNATLVSLGLRSNFSFAAVRANKLARLGIGHTGIKTPGLPF